MDVKNLKVIPKKKKLLDPPRYPKVILGYENEAKRDFNSILQKNVVDLTKTMVQIKKSENA